MKLDDRNGKIYIRDFCFEEIAKKYGTPFYLYDLNSLQERIHNVKRELSDAVELFYAVKANSNLEILKEIRNDINGLDISSAGEMEQALLAGYTPDQMSFAGPGKTYDELQQAIRHQIGIISVESLRELRDIRDIASTDDVKANIALRLNPNLLIKEFALKMGGKSTQFGIDEEDIDVAFAYIRENKNAFNFLGIHVYAGTQCMSEKAIADNIINILNIAADLRATHGIECQWINLGGGLGVSYYDDNQAINLTVVSSRVNQAIDRYISSTGTRPRFILELGRYLIADAGIYVARIVSEKKSRGEMYFVLDGGMNHHLAASGNLGSVIRKNYVIRNLSRSISPKQTCCNLVGPLCTPLDLMGKNISIESPQLGDIVGILKSGAYGFSASPLLFLGHKTPLELMLWNHDIRVIRNRKLLTDFN